MFILFVVQFAHLYVHIYIYWHTVWYTFIYLYTCMCIHIHWLLFIQKFSNAASQHGWSHDLIVRCMFLLTHALLILSSIRALPSGAKNTLQDNLQNQSSRKHFSCFCLVRCSCVNVAAISPLQGSSLAVTCCFNLPSDSYGILSRF